MAISKEQLKLMVKTAASRVKQKVRLNAESRREVESDDEDVPIGLHGILAASEKLLAVNRGMVPADERDSQQFKRIMTTSSLLKERVRLDADKTRLNTLRQVAKFRSLKRMHPFLFDAYTEGHLLGNPLSSPLEEINPISLLESERRITQMGPGGLGSTDAITDEARALHPSQFGFLSSIEGPECFDAETEVFTYRGWVPWPEVTADEVFACRVHGRLEWHEAERLIAKTYKGVLLVAEHAALRMVVTPTHRVLNTRGDAYRVDAAIDVYGKDCRIPSRHAPYLGDRNMTHFTLPSVENGGKAQREFPPFPIEDWCELFGWWLAEGSLTDRGILRFHQCPIASPERYASLRDLLVRMQLAGKDLASNAEPLVVEAKQVVDYFQQWSKGGCYDKWIPEEFLNAPVDAREGMLEVLLGGDKQNNIKRKSYCTVSRRLAESVLHLVVGLGYTAFIRTEPDARSHVATMNYVVNINKQLNRQITARAHVSGEGKAFGSNWSKIPYDGMVYCATVPGGLLHVRGKKSHSGYWSGNSEKIGIDTRAAMGTKIGSDGRLYQRMNDRRAGKVRWVSPEDLADHVTSIPD